MQRVEYKALVKKNKNHFACSSCSIKLANKGNAYCHKGSHIFKYSPYFYKMINQPIPDECEKCKL